MFSLRYICKAPVLLKAILRPNNEIISKAISSVVNRCPQSVTLTSNSSSLLNIASKCINNPVNNFSTGLTAKDLSKSPLLSDIPCSTLQQVRTVTQYTIQKGKRKTVKNVPRRFFRLNWGIWIRTRCGRHKKMYKKSSALKRRLKQHVFCNAKQCSLLDKMVTKFWKRPLYYVDDPYEPYHKREEFPFSRKTPRERKFVDD